MNAMLRPPGEQDVIVSRHQPHPAGPSFGRAPRGTAGRSGAPSHDLPEMFRQ